MFVLFIYCIKFITENAHQRNLYALFERTRKYDLRSYKVFDCFAFFSREFFTIKITKSSSTRGSYTETQAENVPIAVATSQSDVLTTFKAQQGTLVYPIEIEAIVGSREH